MTSDLGDVNERPNSRKVGLVWPTSPSDGGYRRSGRPAPISDNIVQDVNQGIERAFTPTTAASAKRAVYGAINETPIRRSLYGWDTPPGNRDAAAAESPGGSYSPKPRRGTSQRRFTGEQQNSNESVGKRRLTWGAEKALIFVIGATIWAWAVIKLLQWQRFPFRRHRYMVICMCIAPPLCFTALMLIIDAIVRRQRDVTKTE